jgi:hypothetical protein
MSRRAERAVAPRLAPSVSSGTVTAPVSRRAYVERMRPPTRRFLSGFLTLCMLSASFVAIAAVVVASRAYASDYPSVVIADAPVGYWRLGDAPCESGPCTVVDEMGHYDGTADPGVLGAPGVASGDDTAAAWPDGNEIELPSGGSGRGRCTPMISPLRLGSAESTHLVVRASRGSQAATRGTPSLPASVWTISFWAMVVATRASTRLSMIRFSMGAITGC